MKGKEKCKILKEIRQKIATENDIPFVTSKCKHKGDCLGTCPKCEAELVYLENELAKRRALGKRVALAGLIATFTIAGTSCDFENIVDYGATEGEPIENTSNDIVGEVPEAIPSDDYLPLPNEEEGLPLCELKDGMYVFEDGITLPTLETLNAMTDAQLKECFIGVDGCYLRAAYKDAMVIRFKFSTEFRLFDDKTFTVWYDEDGMMITNVALYTAEDNTPLAGDPA